MFVPEDCVGFDFPQLQEIGLHMLKVQGDIFGGCAAVTGVIVLVLAWFGMIAMMVLFISAGPLPP